MTFKKRKLFYPNQGWWWMERHPDCGIFL